MTASRIDYPRSYILLQIVRSFGLRLECSEGGVSVKLAKVTGDFFSPVSRPLPDFETLSELTVE